MALPPDDEIVSKAKNMLLTMRGFRDGAKGFADLDGAPQTVTMSTERMERIVALAMLGLLFQELRRIASADTRAITLELVDELALKWLQETKALLGTPAEDKAA